MQERSKNHVESFKDKRLLKAEDIASILNVSLGFAYQLMKRGDLPTVKIGHAVRVRPSDLEEFVQSHIHSIEDKQKNLYQSSKESYDE